MVVELTKRQDPEKWTLLKCVHCQCEFYKSKERIANGSGKYCTKKCYLDYRNNINAFKRPVINKIRIKKYLRLKQDVLVVEEFVNNPNQPIHKIASKFNIPCSDACDAITKYLAKPRVSMLLNSGIDTPRAIRLERFVRLKEHTETYEFIDGY